MSGVASYILTVTAAAIFVSILQNLAGQGSMTALVKLIAGVFMALTVLSPLLRFEIPDPQQWFSVYMARGQAAAANGADMADDAAQMIIMDQVEAYILDKAALYDAGLTVEVSLSPDGVPVGVILTGPIAPYARARLMQMLEKDLGLGEEMQQWIS